METPHSARTSQHAGKITCLVHFSCQLQQQCSVFSQVQPALSPQTQHFKDTALDSGLNFEERTEKETVQGDLEPFSFSIITHAPATELQ